MLICASKCCIHNKNRTCTLDIIRVSSGGVCEQCSIEPKIDTDISLCEVKQIMQKQSEQPEHKALRSGSTLPE